MEIFQEVKDELMYNMTDDEIISLWNQLQEKNGEEGIREIIDMDEEELHHPLSENFEVDDDYFFLRDGVYESTSTLAEAVDYDELASAVLEGEIEAPFRLVNFIAELG